MNEKIDNALKQNKLISLEVIKEACEIIGYELKTDELSISNKITINEQINLIKNYIKNL